MSTRRFVALFIAALAVIAGAIVLSNQRYLERDPRGGEFVAALNSRLDAISQVLISKDSAQPAVTLDRGKPGQWSIAQRNGYPADAAKVRRLLLALADAKIAEEKTADPANYAAIGVADPAPTMPPLTMPAAIPAAAPASESSGSGTAVSLIAPGGTSTVIIGHSTGNGTFARRSGEKTSVVIEPAVTVESSPRDWIDTKLLDIPLEKIKAVEIHLADGTAYSVSRKTAVQPKAPADNPTDPPKETDFTLDKIPTGRQPAEPSSIGPSPTSFSGVTADDVAVAKDVDFTKRSTARVALFDGGSYAIEGAVVGDKHWVTIDAPSSGAALAARVKDRAFEISSYRYDAIFRPVDQLLKPKPEKPKPVETKAKPASKAKAAKTP